MRIRKTEKYDDSRGVPRAAEKKLVEGLGANNWQNGQDGYNKRENGGGGYLGSIEKALKIILKKGNTLIHCAQER